jgi:hypothetical protein
MMFWKSLISFLLAPILFFLGGNTLIYVAPVSTSTSPKIATSTKQIKSTTKQATTTSQIKTSSKTLTKPLSIAKATTSPKNIINLPVYDFVDINTFARSAIVNILCETKGGELSPISATGVIVSPDGLILTNAHVGQYFLLKDYRQKDFIKCVARTGSPAYPKYNLEIVYISPTWVENNKTILKEQNPTGTGENDFSFLRITSKVDGTNLPDKFSFIPMDTRDYIEKAEPVLLAGYPAGFLGGISILQDLSITTAVTNIGQIYTFKENTPDLLTVSGTVVSQKGASGGAVVDQYATLIGIITTSSDGITTSERDLHAISLSYINRTFKNELGMSISQFLTLDMSEFAKKFQDINVPGLTKLIVDELNKQ